MRIACSSGLDRIHKANDFGRGCTGRRGGEILHWGGNSAPSRIRSASWWRSLARADVVCIFCYEAGPCGYGPVRQLVRNWGMIALSWRPRSFGEGGRSREDADRRDAVCWPSCHRAGELTPLWVRPRRIEANARTWSRAARPLWGFLGKGPPAFAGVSAEARAASIRAKKKGWTVAYRRWFEDGCGSSTRRSRIVFQDYVDAVADPEARR